MNILIKLRSFVVMLFICSFLATATFTSCTGKGGATEEESAEHPAGEEEHPKEEKSEHPAGEAEHPKSESDTTKVEEQ